MRLQRMENILFTQVSYDSARFFLFGFFPVSYLL